MAQLQAIGACCPSKLAFHGMPVHQDNFGCLRKSCFHHEMGARSSGFCGQMMNLQELQQKHISWNQGIQNGVTGETNKDAVLSRKTDVLGSNNSGQLCEKLNKVVLGYIGGLDTSVIVPWLRIRLKVSQHSFLCKAKTDASEVASHRNFATIPSSLLTAEREEAKAVLTLFLKRQGLSNTVAARIINKSDCFVDHLILKLHSMHKSRYLVGRELTTLEIRGALIPYLESLLEEHGDALVDFVENFPDPPGTERAASTSPINSNNSSSKKERAVARVSQLSSDGLLPEHVLYLVDLGMNLEQIKNIARKFPAFAYYNLDRKIKPVVEFLLELGVPRSDIPTILIKRPQLCGISFSDNLKPMMAYLENLGVDKSKWAKVIYRFPALLTYSRQKVKATLDYLSELGVSEKNIGKILTRCPHIISYSVEDKLRPTADYFQSIGIDVASLMHKCPQTFGLSIEANLKPVTEFFLERGYSKAEVSTMVHRYGALYTFSLADNLIPKWNYFLTMDYPKSELVKFPHYFGYSLEERIKPRYSWVRECGVKLILNQVLSVSDHQFEKILEKKMDKLADAHFPQRKNNKNTS